MKVLKHKAADMLLEKVKSLQARHDSWRCIYVNLADERGRYNHSLLKHFVINAITDLLTEQEGYIYLCEDGDIFILFQGPIKPILTTLGSHFEGLDPDTFKDQPNDRLFTIFDLSRYWQLFYSLCKVKAMKAAQGVADLAYVKHTMRMPYAHAAQES